MNNEKTITSDEYLDFVNDNPGRNNPSTSALYYQRTFEKQGPNRKLFISWSWFAFLFSPFWMVYRRLYWQAVVFMIVAFSFHEILELVTKGPKSAIFCCSLIPDVLLGLFGVAIYQRQVIDWMKDNKTSKKGVNEKLVWILVVLSLLSMFFVGNDL